MIASSCSENNPDLTLIHEDVIMVNNENLSKSQIPRGIEVFDWKYKGNDPDLLCHSWGGNCLETVVVTADDPTAGLTNQDIDTLHNLLSNIIDTGDITSYILNNENFFNKILYQPYLDSANFGSYYIKNHLLYSNGLTSINFYDQDSDTLIIAYPVLNDY